MNHARATALIERYFAGETTLAEEAALKDYFRTSDVAQELQAYAPLFQYWDREARISAPPRLRTRHPARWLPALAAALLLLLVARGVHHLQQPALNEFPVAERTSVDWSRHEIKDEEEALRFLHTVLGSTSRQMNQGTAITLRELRQVERILN